MKKMKKSIYVIALSVLFLSACKNDKKPAESKEAPTQEMHMEEADAHDHGDHDHDASKSESSSKEDRGITATTEKSNATSAIIDGYLQIKNALVADNKDGAAEAGTVLLTAFSNFDMKQLTEDQHKEYMEIVENAKEQAEHIVKSPIDHQREHLEVLSNDVNDLIALLGTDKTLYQVFCPMANGGEGAMWLSEIEAIKNPFYGSKMLKCGKVQKKIN
ncbi:MAG: heavy metal transporter [Lutibacter sp.]|nr:MAG: heavy metal transporter [Lutibacter sp.]